MTVQVRAETPEQVRQDVESAKQAQTQAQLAREEVARKKRELDEAIAAMDAAKAEETKADVRGIVGGLRCFGVHRGYLRCCNALGC